MRKDKNQGWTTCSTDLRDVGGPWESSHVPEVGPRELDLAHRPTKALNWDTSGTNTDGDFLPWQEDEPKSSLQPKALEVPTWARADLETRDEVTSPILEGPSGIDHMGAVETTLAM